MTYRLNDLSYQLNNLFLQKFSNYTFDWILSTSVLYMVTQRNWIYDWPLEMINFERKN